jgi:hypothetical protein
MTEVKQKTPSLRLKLVEKRSIVYARLPASIKGGPSDQPARIEYIPYSTLAWIENLLKKGKTDWPWFAVVLRFINSTNYAAIEQSIVSEIERNKEAKRAFYASFPRQRSQVKNSPKVPGSQQTLASWPSVRPSGDRPYFWENIDTLLWREQE